MGKEEKKREEEIKCYLDLRKNVSHTKRKEDNRNIKWRDSNDRTKIEIRKRK